MVEEMHYGRLRVNKLSVCFQHLL